MLTIIKYALLFIIGLWASTYAAAQATADVGIKTNFAGGEVVLIADGKISLKTMDGPIDVMLAPTTVFKTIPPDNPSLKAAVDSKLEDIAVGDKLLVTGLVALDKLTMPAKTVYLMTKASINQKLSKEQEDWRVRGTSGTVVSIDPMTNGITVSVRGGGPTPARSVVVKPGANTEYMRYAPDSIEFGRAVKSTIADIQKGDEIRVLGDKSADGMEVAAERIVSGSFKTTSGTIKSINAETGEVTISDLITKKDVTVKVMQTSILKQFPAEMANRLVQFQIMAAMGQGGMRPPTGGQTPGQTPNQTPAQTQGQTQGSQQNPQVQQRPQGGGTGTGQGMGGGMRGNFDDSRLPPIQFADLKVGEIIGVLSTKPNDPAKVRAIKLFTGVKPFIDAAQAQASMGQRGGGGGAGAGFSIPGLDGFGN